MQLDRSLTPERYQIKYHITEGQDGIRLDRFLSSQYRNRSREQLKSTIEKGAIQVIRNQSPHLKIGKLKPSSQLLAGDKVLVNTFRKKEPKVNERYSIIYEDDVLLVVDKPAHLPVHPAGSYLFNTLSSLLKFDGYEPNYLVHRIDKETSGVLLLAKDKVVCAHLTEQFRNREVSKNYLAVVHGIPPRSFNIQSPLKRSETSSVTVKMEVSTLDRGGLPAETFIKRKSIHGGYSLVECTPKTGRQHQIRAHLTSRGFPIVGDKLYGLSDKESLEIFDGQFRGIRSHLREKLILDRHALHASLLQIIHPITGKTLKFHSEIPKIMKDFLTSQEDSLSNGHLFQDKSHAAAHKTNSQKPLE